jgi:peroxiredoxin
MTTRSSPHPARGRSSSEARTQLKAGSNAPKSRKGRAMLVTVIAIAVVGVLFAIYSTATRRSSADGTTPETSYAVGSPGVGEQAPGFTLPLAGGGEVDLADYRGQRVLLYFQEGLMCQPCWDQITDLESASEDVEAAGVDAVLSITSDPVHLLTQKVADEGITTPVATDVGLAVSRQYSTNQYGMMGGTHNGHSFLLVGPEGMIEWRADYGGPPDYTMYLPVDRLLADLRAGTSAASESGS